jgi:hypothetical protein
MATLIRSLVKIRVAIRAANPPDNATDTVSASLAGQFDSDSLIAIGWKTAEVSGFEADPLWAIGQSIVGSACKLENIDMGVFGRNTAFQPRRRRS